MKISEMKQKQYEVTDLPEHVEVEPASYLQVQLPIHHERLEAEWIAEARAAALKVAKSNEEVLKRLIEEGL